MSIKFLFIIFLLTLISSSVFSQSSGKQTTATDIILKTDYVRITGDTTIDRSKIFYTSVKFEPYISFNDYKPKALYNGVKAPIDFKSNLTARQYRTRISETYKDKGLNFAGRYCFVYWGCGSPCKSSAIVDLITGKVYDGPPSELGYEYRKDSNMLIVNPPDSSGFFDDCPYCHPQIWIWDENSKKFKQKKPAIK